MIPAAPLTSLVIIKERTYVGTAQPLISETHTHAVPCLLSSHALAGLVMSPSVQVSRAELSHVVTIQVGL